MFDKTGLLLCVLSCVVGLSLFALAAYLGDDKAQKTVFDKQLVEGWVVDGRTGEPITEDELIDFFGEVADASPVPVAIQNAPQYIGVGLTSHGLDRLNRHHPNVQLLKAEVAEAAAAPPEQQRAVQNELGKKLYEQGTDGRRKGAKR